MRIIAIIIVLLLLAQTGASREESGWTGPDSFLYPFKIWVEKFSLNFAFNQTEKTRAMLDLAEERLREAENVDNSSRAYERAMDEYASQLEELESIITKDMLNESKKIRVDIKEKIGDHINRTKSIKSRGNVSIIQLTLIEASSSSGESSIKVRVVDGDVSVETEGETNNSRQQVIVRSSGNASSSSSVVVHSSSKVVSGN